MESAAKNLCWARPVQALHVINVINAWSWNWAKLIADICCFMLFPSSYSANSYPLVSLWSIYDPSMIHLWSIYDPSMIHCFLSCLSLSLSKARTPFWRHESHAGSCLAVPWESTVKAVEVRSQREEVWVSKFHAWMIRFGSQCVILLRFVGDLKFGLPTLLCGKVSSRSPGVQVKQLPNAAQKFIDPPACGGSWVTPRNRRASMIWNDMPVYIDHLFLQCAQVSTSNLPGCRGYS